MDLQHAEIIRTILGLLIAISIFYSFGYRETSGKNTTKKRKEKRVVDIMFKLAFLFLFAILSIIFFILENYNNLAYLFFILFLFTLVYIVQCWFSYYLVKHEMEEFIKSYWTFLLFLIGITICYFLYGLNIEVMVYKLGIFLLVVLGIIKCIYIIYKKGK